MLLGIHDVFFQELLINSLNVFVFHLNFKLFVLNVLLKLRRMTLYMTVDYEVSKSVVIDHIELVLKY